MALIRMIFAVQLTDPKPTRIRVSGNVGTPAPVMTSLRRGDREPSPVDCVNGSWTMELAAGDYLIQIQVEDWVPGRLDVVAEVPPEQSPPTFVYHGPSQVGLTAWTTTALRIDSSERPADSKDPWPPPPLAATPTVALAQVSLEWFTAELAAAQTRIAAQPAGKAPPQYVIDALVRGS